jgi:exodeoxyribonuclease-3
VQETKCQDHDFPFSEFKELGYEAAIAGQKSYNGVALLSRHPIQNVRIGLAGGGGDSMEPQVWVPVPQSLSSLALPQTAMIPDGKGRV